MKRLVVITTSALRQTTSSRPIYPHKCLPRRSVSTVYNPATPSRRFYSQTPEKTAKACPSCGSPLDIKEISCKNCKALSPLPENVNYLSLFGFPTTAYDIDLRKLKSEYLKLMSKVHPDSVSQKSDVPPQNQPKLTNRIKNE